MRSLLAAALAALAAVAFTTARAAGKAEAKSCPRPSIIKVRWDFEALDDQDTTGNFWVSYDAQGQTGTLYLDSVAAAGAEPSSYSPFDFPVHKSTALVSTSDLGFEIGQKAQVHLRVKLDCGTSTEVMLRVQVPDPGSLLFDIKQSPWCADYEVIDSRGSGEPAGLPSPPGQRFIDRFEEMTPGLNAEVETNPYPAAGSLASMLLAWAKLPHGAYHASVIAGKRYLAEMLGDAEKQCPDTPIYLVGYSQGAQITADIYQAGSWPLVQGVVLFGDPYFNPGDPVDRSNFSRRQYGILGKRKLFDKAIRPFVRSYCHARDPICQGLSFRDSFYQHKNYDWQPDGAALRAADWLTLLW